MKKYIIPADNGYQAYLEKIYIQIREAGLEDIATIAKNTGLSEADLIKLKKHLFFDTHNLSVEGKALQELYFQADSEIAYAWQKAMNGELTPVQKQWFEELLNHELTESKLMGQGMPLRDPSTWTPDGFLEDAAKNAHDKANITAPQPSDFPNHDAFEEFMKHVDDDIEY